MAFAFWITMVGTTVPTPLYPLYERRFGFEALSVTVIFAVYAGGVVVGLTGFGRLSDQIGRRPVQLIALALAAAGCVVFLLAGDLGWLLVGRVLSGFAAALMTGAATAGLADLAPPDGRARAALVALAANMGGLASGTALAGILAEWAPAPLRLVWAVVLGLSVLAAAGVATGPESAARRTGFVAGLQRLRIPAEIRGTFVRAAMAAGAGFAVLGVLTAVTGLFLGAQLHLANHAVAGLAVGIAFVGIAVGQLLVRVLPAETALPAACAGLVVGATLIVVTMATATLAPLLVAAALNGLATGVAIGSGLAAINTGVPAARRGEAVSTFFAVLYTMLTVPAVGVGVLIRLTSLRTAGVSFGIVVAVLAAVVLVSLRRGADQAVQPGTATSDPAPR